MKKASIKKVQKPKEGLPLHQFVATGGKPKSFPRSKALNSSTVPNLKSKK